MSILHTLKRKLRSCRRQQDDVLADHANGSYQPLRPVYPEDLVVVPPEPEENQPTKKVELEPWVLAALERMENTAAFDRSWFTPVSDDERKTFRELSQGQKETALKTATQRINMMAGCTYGFNAAFRVNWEGRLSVHDSRQVEKK